MLVQCDKCGKQYDITYLTGEETAKLLEGHDIKEWVKDNKRFIETDDGQHFCSTCFGDYKE